MQPGHPVYEAIVRQFGAEVVHTSDATLDRAALAQIAFGEGRIDELNAIVHPAVIRQQQKLMDQIAVSAPGAVVMIESALIFETKYGATDTGGWRTRFDKLVLVTAPETARVSRFIQRSSMGRSLTEEERTSLEAEAYRRMAQQMPDEQKAALCDYVLTNSGSLVELEWQVDRLWPLLLADAPACIR